MHWKTIRAVQEHRWSLSNFASQTTLLFIQKGKKKFVALVLDQIQPVHGSKSRLVLTSKMISSVFQMPIRYNLEPLGPGNPHYTVRLLCNGDVTLIRLNIRSGIRKINKSKK